MRAGALHYQVKIERLVDGKDAMGAPVSAWEPHVIVWADIRDISGREYMAAGQVVGDATTQIIIRHRGDVAAGMRAVELVSGRIYDITAVLSDARRTRETLMARHGVSAG